MSCYKYEKKVFNEGLLDNSIDATYIIHLENNGRLPNILEQLNKYQPSKIVYIVFNKGYKKCKKNLLVQSTTYDIVDSFLQILKDANNKKYNNILILEDDFMFDEKIKNKEVINDINNSISSKTSYNSNDNNNNDNDNTNNNPPNVSTDVKVETVSIINSSGPRVLVVGGAVVDMVIHFLK